MPGCCPPGALGPASGPAMHALKPRGHVVTLTAGNASHRPDLPCYQVGPTAPQRIIVVFSDVFGVDAGNHKVFCDALQQRLGPTTCVWMPDLFRGRPLMSTYTGVDALDALLNISSFVWSVYTRLTVSQLETDLFEIIQPHVQEALRQGRHGDGGKNNPKDTAEDDNVSQEPPCPPLSTRVGVAGFCFGGWVPWRNHHHHRTASFTQAWACIPHGPNPKLW